MRRPRFLEALFFAHLFATPPTGVLPLVRRVAGRTRVQAGPYPVILLNAWLHGAVRRYQRAAGRSPRQRALAGYALVAWQALTPAVASVPRRTVVLRGRSPMWGYLADLVLGAALDGLVRRRVERERSGRP